MSEKSASSTKKSLPVPDAPVIPPTDTEPGRNAAPGVTIGAAAGAAAGAGFWGLAMPAANFIGFTTSGIASGSTAASMMSTAAVANGGGVASGSAVAVMQSIGAVGLATPIGLALVAGGAAIGGAAFLMKSQLSSRTDGEAGVVASAMPGTEDEGKDLWVLVEMSPDSPKPIIRTLEDDYKARNAFLNSSATSKALYDPEKKIALELGWDQSVNVDFGDTKV